MEEKRPSWIHTHTHIQPTLLSNQIQMVLQTPVHLILNSHIKNPKTTKAKWQPTDDVFSRFVNKNFILFHFYCLWRIWLLLSILFWTAHRRTTITTTSSTIVIINTINWTGCWRCEKEEEEGNNDINYRGGVPSNQKEINEASFIF